jgi:hypothetical protein
MLLPRATWQALAAAHDARVAPLADATLARRATGKKHAVEDFLFSYYNFPPGKLKQWLPPIGTSIEITATDLTDYPHLQTNAFVLRTATTATLDTALLPEKTRTLAAWVATLCRNILDRPPRFRCFGLHEWAMVFRQTPEQIRHQGHALRLPPEQLATFVESQALCCTHYDAYRFFTAAASPLNAFQPTLETRLDMEQGACLHTNMDLYKWAAKLWPWIGSDLVGQAFALAQEGRTLDMRASPYDLAHLGYDPIPIETPEGRQTYEHAQRQLAEKSRPLRAALAQAAETLHSVA